jgi:hypothetical protein
MNNSGVILVDLDGTLAQYDGYKGHEHIGEPVPLMLLRVRRWLTSGQTVKLFTARASNPDAIPAIKTWLIKHGIDMEITNQKDYTAVQIWDDRAIQIIPNTGLRADRIDDLK